MQQFVDDLEQFLIMHDDFFAKYPVFLGIIICGLVLWFLLDVWDYYRTRRNCRVYYCCGDEGDLCTCKLIYSKKLRANVIIPEIYQEDFDKDSITKKYLRIGDKYRKSNL